MALHSHAWWEKNVIFYLDSSVLCMPYLPVQQCCEFRLWCKDCINQTVLTKTVGINQDPSRQLNHTNFHTECKKIWILPIGMNYCTEHTEYTFEVWSRREKIDRISIQDQRCADADLTYQCAFGFKQKKIRQQREQIIPLYSIDKRQVPGWAGANGVESVRGEPAGVGVLLRGEHRKAVTPRDFFKDICSAKYCIYLSFIRIRSFLLHFFSVVDPGSDTYVFGPPASGSVSQRYGFGSGSFYHQAKIVWKPWFLPFCDFFMTLSLKKLRKCIFKKYRNKQEN